MTLLRPWWLALLPVLVCLVWALRRRGPDAGGWQKVLSPQMLAGLAALDQIAAAPGWLRLLPLGGAAVLTTALAGPALPRSDAPVFAQHDAVVLALDMSASITRGRGLPDAQAVAAQIMAGLPGRPIGLILYAGEAYIAAAPTGDPRVLESLLSVLDDKTMPDKSSSPAAALVLAGQMLEGLARADLVLISDGGGIDATAEAEARRLSEMGVRIRALAVQGDPPADAEGLRRIAPDGVYAVEASGQIVTDLRRARVTRDPAMVALQYRDLGPWLAALALIPLLWQFRRQA